MPKKIDLKCYFGCPNDGPMHRFPKWDYPNEERFNTWKNVLSSRTQEYGNEYIYNNIRLCYRHFEEYFQLPSHNLTRNAVPTLHLTVPEDLQAMETITSSSTCNSSSETQQVIDVPYNPAKEQLVLTTGTTSKYCSWSAITLSTSNCDILSKFVKTEHKKYRVRGGVSVVTSNKSRGEIPKPGSGADDDGADVYGCDLCKDGGWVSETEVELHKTKEHYTKAFLKRAWNSGEYCCICVTKCGSEAEVLKHIKTEHLLSSEDCLRVEREVFVCDLCSAVFFNQQNLVIHLRYSHRSSSNGQSITCLLCTKNIKMKNIPAHFYLHQIQSVSTCRICLEKFRNSRVLEKHIRRHPLYLKCEMCQFQTDRSESFHDHIVKVHKNSNKNVILMTDDTRDHGSLMTAETKDGSTSKKNHSVNNDDGETVTFIEIKVDKPHAKMKDESVDSKDLITVNDLISDAIKDELIDSELITGDVKEELTTGNDHDLTTKIAIEIDTNGGVKIKKENDNKGLMTDDTKDFNDTEDLMMDDVKEETVDESLLMEDRKAYVKRDFRRFFIPKKSTFVKLQRVAGLKGLLLTNNVHICVLCREICVGTGEMWLHVNEHSAKVETKTKYLYECSCGEGFHSKVLYKHHTFKTKHV